jgi:hypothetical protein
MQSLSVVIAALLACGLAASCLAAEGVVADAATGAPIAGASVMLSGRGQLTNADGAFSLPGTGELSVRAIGHMRHNCEVTADTAPLHIRLPALKPKALYLSAHGVASAVLREQALALIGRTELNALVIDIKDDRGASPHHSDAAARAGIDQPHKPMVPDMAGLMAALKARRLYLIARIVTFKDEPLATAHPEWAVRRADGSPWKDREGLGWIDPSRPQAWARALDMAAEAAELGFDEIQFDYVRFPDAPGLRFKADNTRANRVAAINAFLDAARHRLAPYNVFLSADIFGYVIWNDNDTGIGQELASIAQRVDYVSPMLYPSGFTFGIPGQDNPVAAPFVIVDRSLRLALKKTGLAPVHLRPWLQAFRDYGFDRRHFGEWEIRQQIEAAEGVGTQGWMLWNAQNRYEAAGIKATAPPASH